MHARNESWRGEPVALADGSSLDIGSLSHDRLVELQWEQERDFARRFLAADKGSPARAAAVRRALRYDYFSKFPERKKCQGQ
ncbi:MAG: hypothetical protein IT426_20140 [Pirellulales bacterium]|nr:hypothetical protein [Pirellulales bacterium]